MRQRTGRAAIVLGAILFVRSSIGAAATPGVRALADRDPDQYLTFGDSITWGLESFGYQPRLQILLTAKYGQAKIWNAGIGGEETAGGLARIDAALAATNSKYLLLMEGTNDAADLFVTIDSVEANLREMCRRAIAVGCTPVLATITPRSDWIWYVSTYRARYDDLNLRIRRIASDLKITLADAYAAFMDYPSASGGYTALLYDGVHPNSTGYQVLAETWFAALKVVKYDPPGAPLNPVLDTRLDATETRKINVVAWQANPVNAALTLKGYAIYRKPAALADSAFAKIGSVSASVFRYEDAGLEVPVKYAYRVTTLSPVSDESAPSATAVETVSFAFPPLGLSVRTFPAGGSGIGKKINVVSFAPNPLNDASLIAGYRVYRKKSGESDASYAETAFLGPTTYRVVDLYVPSPAGCQYAVTTIYSDGTESKKSAPVSGR